MAKGLAIAALIAGGGWLAWRAWRDGTISAPVALDFTSMFPAGDFSFTAPDDWSGFGPAVAGGLADASPEAFLQSRGLTADQARGVVAGAWAESRLDPFAVNPSSGAFGIGQWLGSRKAELFRQYGPNPTLAQQWEFLAWELGGGDHGGKAVLSETTATGALDAYIRRFMRPAAGAETSGDLARGLRYLG